MNAPIPAICYDLGAVSRFFRSVALAAAFQRHTKTEWVTDNSSSFINSLYTVLFWKEPPGTVEVFQSSKDAIDRTTDQLHEQYLKAWLHKLHEKGPDTAWQYVEDMRRVRDHALGALAELYRDAQHVNEMVAGETRDAIVFLAQVKLGSTIGVAAIGATASLVLASGGALIASGVSLGYSSACSLIKTWEQGSSAKAVAVSIEASKAGASEALGKAAEVKGVKALAQKGRAEQIIRSCEGEIRKYSERIMREGLSKRKIAKAKTMLSNRTASVGAQQQILNQAARSARLANIAKVGVPIVFAAWDILEGFSDYNETVDGLLSP